MKPVFVLLCLLAPTSALACFGGLGQSLFACTVQEGRSAVQVCLQGNAAYYAFGPVGGAPEVVLARPVQDVEMAPWPGIGRTYWEEAAFRNDGYEYRLIHAVDKMDKDAQVEGTLLVRENDVQVAELTCDPGTVTAHDFHPLFTAKGAAGQCWGLDGKQWSPC